MDKVSFRVDNISSKFEDRVSNRWLLIGL